MKTNSTDSKKITPPTSTKGSGKQSANAAPKSSSKPTPVPTRPVSKPVPKPAPNPVTKPMSKPILKPPPATTKSSQVPSRSAMKAPTTSRQSQQANGEPVSARYKPVTTTRTAPKSRQPVDEGIAEKPDDETEDDDSGPVIAAKPTKKGHKTTDKVSWKQVWRNVLKFYCCLCYP
ncbi:hypothetical protein GHT06_008539 [Daphnia sinensis]|uniref:Uncharacterized protein n=1 Tax=Daphnia sinensis TaxID=1820382 RepID=A0AAD5LVH6_9CRUS|nr:hypothetical protein GHT06_008539 [Daphnia sinensis]